MAESDTDLIPGESLAPLDGEDWSQSIHVFAWFLLTMLLLLGDLGFRLYRTLLALHISLVGGNLLCGSFIIALIIDLHVDIVVVIDSLLLGIGHVYNAVLVFRIALIALIMIIVSIIIPILGTGDVILRSVIAVIVFIVFVRCLVARNKRTLAEMMLGQ